MAANGSNKPNLPAICLFITQALKNLRRDRCEPEISQSQNPRLDAVQGSSHLLCKHHSQRFPVPFPIYRMVPFLGSVSE